ncbi:hypothetical protein [Paenibacillus thalictri]|uniref:Uncharacterized protein n=1 Tax=Paenibacillus thalictri TaxID=2527873 RepID=A0A4Q9DND4_9BACL|nr:hypothetical protein [Paenibacillus thalictri]TBL77415.1 hypothetical protein EYB31_18265 [Paenibacillus thalictri]
MPETWEEQGGLTAMVELLSDMIINYLALEEKKAVRKAGLAWLDEIMWAEAEEIANRELAAQKLGTWDFELVA